VYSIPRSLRILYQRSTSCASLIYLTQHSTPKFPMTSPCSTLSGESCAVGGWSVLALALTSSEIRNEYRFTNTQKRLFHTCEHYPWNGIFREGSISYRNAGGPCLSEVSAVDREIQGFVWNSNKQPICATLFVLRNRYPRSPVKHADPHDARQIQKGCDNRGRGNKYLGIRSESLAMEGVVRRARGTT